MIGPKQFDIKHKTKPKREYDNPIVTHLFGPKFKYRENNLKEMVESFVDKFKAPLFEFEEQEIVPLSKEITFNPNKHEDKLENIRGSFLDKFNTTKIEKPKIKEKESAKEEAKEPSVLSQEMINQITYKVFQNIKDYLDRDKKGSDRNKGIGIRLEIDL